MHGAMVKIGRLVYFLTILEDLNLQQYRCDELNLAQFSLLLLQSILETKQRVG